MSADVRPLYWFEGDAWVHPLYGDTFMVWGHGQPLIAANVGRLYRRLAQNPVYR